MYNPQKFKETDMDLAFDLMDKYSFSTVVTVYEGKSFISHLPLTPMRAGNEIELFGHLAKANPHWKLLANGQTTFIFQGANTYITPKWYVHDDVPTWNYSVAHVSGEISLIEDREGLIECLKVLTSKSEEKWPSDWDFYVPEDLQGNNIEKYIVGFRVKVKELNFKRKLSQNKTVEDQKGVIKGLKERKDEQSQQVLADMIQIYEMNL